MVLISRILYSSWRRVAVACGLLFVFSTFFRSEYQNADGEPVGLDVYTGDAISPEAEGIWDNYVVKKEMLALAPVGLCFVQLLLVFLLGVGPAASAS